MREDVVNDTVEESVSKELYNFGKRCIAVKHAQLRMGCSQLNSHLYNLHVKDSPSCQCGFNYEDASHFLLNCPWYVQERNELMLDLQTISITNTSVNLLLKGNSEYGSYLI